MTHHRLGDSDVGDIVILVTLWWWLISDVGGRIIMLATFPLCWWFSRSITSILNRSPNSQTCHQHIWSPTYLTNIDVTGGIWVRGFTSYFELNIVHDWIEFLSKPTMEYQMVIRVFFQPWAAVHCFLTYNKMQHN